MNSRIKRLPGLSTFVLVAFLILAPGMAQLKRGQIFRPIKGSRMIVGDGKVPVYILDCFLHLCRDSAPDIVVVCLGEKPRANVSELKERGAGSIQLIESIPGDIQSLIASFLKADGIWIEGGVDSLKDHPMLLSLMNNVLQKNGVIAFGSASVSAIYEIENAAVSIDAPESSLARCKFHFDLEQFRKLESKEGIATSQSHWFIANSSALIIHQERAIAGFGEGEIIAMVPATNGWPMRRQEIETIDIFERNEVPGYSLDLLSWVRSAAERESHVFPPAVATVPNVQNGTLVLHGGSGVTDEVFGEFVDAAGGKDAPIVCIPSASRFGAMDDVRSYSAGRLAELGCTNVIVLHTSDPLVANGNKAFSEPLNYAKGVWIDGGRTYRFMDCYQNTRVHSLLNKVLQSGGVVGGSSAGCQVAGDFLVRGNPRSNQDILHGGYTRGLGLVGGVVIDAHFLQRGRHGPFAELMKEHPQMLGVGIDEKTAIVVQGSTARVFGPNAVSFYDYADDSAGDSVPVILHAGDGYDLKHRKKLK